MKEQQKSPTTKPVTNKSSVGENDIFIDNIANNNSATVVDPNSSSLNKIPSEVGLGRASINGYLSNLYNTTTLQYCEENSQSLNESEKNQTHIKSPEQHMEGELNQIRTIPSSGTGLGDESIHGYLTEMYNTNVHGYCLEYSQSLNESQKNQNDIVSPDKTMEVKINDTKDDQNQILETKKSEKVYTRPSTSKTGLSSGGIDEYLKDLYYGGIENYLDSEINVLATNQSENTMAKKEKPSVATNNDCDEMVTLGNDGKEQYPIE